MLLATAVFLFVTLSIVGGYVAIASVPGVMAQRRVGLRLREVGPEPIDADVTVVMQRREGPMPIVDRMLARTAPGVHLAKLIEQSGIRTTPSGVVLTSIGAAITAGLLTTLFVVQPIAPFIAFVAGLAGPYVWLLQRRSSRIKRFEEQFPEALDLMARAIKAGHAFQTALGMAADELRPPVGPEFKKTFDEQNFGLPLKEALNGLAERTMLLDVRFFVTAVAIQRDTGGNLAEILENLAHVVRERFKIRRQVRIHTAHGRFTGYVLLALPAALAVALSSISPDSMQLLFREPMGRMMLGGAVILQTIGFVWIRQVIKIEV